MEQPLTRINNGQFVTVTRIESGSLRVKLMEMGLVEGKVLEVLYRAPLGDPIAVNVEGYVLSLRRDEAQMVLVNNSMIEK